jgi:hypothetical protein
MCSIDQSWLNSTSLQNYKNTHIRWAERIYRQWCEKMSTDDPFPLTSRVSEFILFLRSGNSPYMVNTVINIVSCLKHANLKSTKNKIANERAVKINECIAYTKKK